MRKGQSTKKLAEWTAHVLVSGVAGIVVSLFGAFLSLYVSQTKPATPDILALNHNLVYLVGGIILLGFVIVGIASLMRRNSRDVILFKQSLAEIYLAALRKSALNPDLRS